MTPEERFWSKVKKGPGCWEWQGFIAPNGYGRFWLNGRNIGAHVAAVLFSGREIPEGMEPDHLCRNRACPRPDHLEVVTHRENTLRRPESTKERCAQGHELAGDNLYIWPRRGWRKCRACMRQSKRRTVPA